MSGLNSVETTVSIAGKKVHYTDYNGNGLMELYRVPVILE